MGWFENRDGAGQEAFDLAGMCRIGSEQLDEVMGARGVLDPFLVLGQMLAGQRAEANFVQRGGGGRTPTSYTMDHSAGSYVYDTAGRLRVYHRYGSGAQSLAADVRALLDEAR